MEEQRSIAISKRSSYIDVAKGIGILLVCLGHSVESLETPLNRVILSFHMPLFFFITGMLMNGNESIVLYVQKKVKSLLIPQITMGIIALTANVLIDSVITKQIPFDKVDLISPFSSWFLLAMFVSCITFHSMLLLTKKSPLWCCIFVAMCMVAFLFLFDKNVYILEQSVVACIFIGMGYLSKKIIDTYIDDCPFKGGGQF